jgi:hypothetical protein
LLGDDVDGALADLKTAAELDSRYGPEYQEYMHALATAQAGGADNPTATAAPQAAAPGSSNASFDDWAKSKGWSITSRQLYIASVPVMLVVCMTLYGDYRKRKEN